MRCLARVIRLTPIWACVALTIAVAPASARVEVTTSPRLQPAFRPGVSDYVSRCAPDKPLLVTVHASSGERVSVAGRSEHGGDFETKLERQPGARASIRVRTPGGASRTYNVRCLPTDFPQWTFRRGGKPQAQWYVVTPVKPSRGGYAAVFDTDGVPVWWLRSPRDYMPWDAKLLDDGLLAIGHNRYSPFGISPESGYEERTLGGDLVRLVHTSGSPTDVHDLQRLPNGHFLAITYRPRDNVDLRGYGGPQHARVFDGELQELTSSGHVVWRWNSAKHFSPSETERAYWYNDAVATPPPRLRGYDLLHINSVQPDGDGLIVSARHLDAVFRIDRATGNVDWKLGGTFVAGKSLTVTGTPLGQPPLGGQHDARTWKDGTLTVYDNRTDDAGQPPAAERFRINTLARTATRIERITEPDVSISKWGGSARKLPGGNWVVCWAGAPVITEQTPAGRVLLSLRFTGDERSYRAQPLSPGRLRAAALRRGMDAMVRSAQR